MLTKTLEKKFSRTKKNGKTSFKTRLKNKNKRNKKKNLMNGKILTLPQERNRRIFRKISKKLINNKNLAHSKPPKLLSRQ
jgi:hypothetical protein